MNAYVSEYTISFAYMPYILMTMYFIALLLLSLSSQLFINFGGVSITQPPLETQSRVHGAKSMPMMLRMIEGVMKMTLIVLNT